MLIGYFCEYLFKVMWQVILCKIEAELELFDSENVNF